MVPGGNVGMESTAMVTGTMCGHSVRGAQLAVVEGLQSDVGVCSVRQLIRMQGGSRTTTASWHSVAVGVDTVA